MQIELFSLLEVDDREIYSDTAHHMTAKSTRRKRRYPVKDKRRHTKTIHTI